MKKWKKLITSLTVAALLAVVCAGSALAAEDRTKISSVTITINYDVTAGDEDISLTASCSSSHYDVSEWEVTNDEGYWSAGDVPKVEITLEADDDYYFGSMSSSSVNLKGDGATYSSSRRTDSNSTLIVTVKLDAVEGDYELESCEWLSDSSPVAVWDDEEGVDSYQVRLYRNGSSVNTATTTTNRYYDFGSQITRTGDYTFRVRAYKSSSKHGEWIESDELYVDDYMLAYIQNGNYDTLTGYSYGGGPGDGGTSSNPGYSGPASPASYGWQYDNIGGWWYLEPDGTYPRGGWLQIDGIWYCFNDVGYMRTGWIQSANGNWYYCDSSGAMLTNTWTPDGYYVDGNGIWIPNAV